MQNLSYAHGPSNTPLIGETIGENFRKSVEKFGNREALISIEQAYRATYKELWEQTTALAKGLMASGIRRGDRVGIWAPNRFEWVLVQYATARIGAIMVNINPSYKPTGLKFALEQSKVDLLISASHSRQINFVEMLDAIRPTCEYPKQTIIIEKDWNALLSAGAEISDEKLATREESLQFDDSINIQYTSGTTGYPKGATLSHHNILNDGYFCGVRMHYTEKEKVCIPVPLYHCFGMVLGSIGCISHGACIVLTGETFHPDTVMRTIQEEKCTALFGVPTMYISMLDHYNFNKYDFSSLRTGIMGGSLCPTNVMRQVIDKMNMTQITICFGMTETSPMVTQSMVSDSLEKRVNTVGVIHDHLEVKIVDPQGNILPKGVAGEVCVRGYAVMIGYWDNPTATSDMIDKNKWLHTGDIGEMDEEGYIKITGRIKDTIIRRGENISPREIEEFLIAHKAISDVYVIGVPSVKYGEEVMAWVKKRDESLTKEELILFCRDQIAPYKIPKYWKFVEEFPMTVSGKVRKVEMREIAIKELAFNGKSN